MASTSPHAIVYPTTADNVALASHYANLANSVETALTANEAWSSWTPTWSSGGFTALGGAGVSEGFYNVVGDMVHAEFRIQIAAGFAVVAATQFAVVLPVAAYIWAGSGVQHCVGNWNLRDDSAVQHYSGSCGIWAGTSVAASFSGVWDGTSPKVRISDTAPITWAASDVLSANFSYRAA